MRALISLACGVIAAAAGEAGEDLGRALALPNTLDELRRPTRGEVPGLSNCTVAMSPDGRVPVECCFVASAEAVHENLEERYPHADALPGWACFPSWVVGGTQKSGTTALAGHLLRHPQVRLPAKKEVHFYDDRRRKSRRKKEALRGPMNEMSYLWSFEGLGRAAALPERVPFASGDLSPAYMTYQTFCSDLTSFLPETRVIVLLREPGARAYSEWQMKARRVGHQNGVCAAAAAATL